MTRVRLLALACVVSALAFALGSAAWVRITIWMEHSPTTLKGYARTAGIAFLAALIVQATFGSALYYGLSTFRAFRLWAVAIAYCGPVVGLALFFGDSYSDLVGALPWLVLALIFAVAFWSVLSLPIHAPTSGLD